MTPIKVWQLSVMGLDGLLAWIPHHTPHQAWWPGSVQGSDCLKCVNMDSKKSLSLSQEKLGCYQQKKNSEHIKSTQVHFPEAQSLLLFSSCVDRQADVHCDTVNAPIRSNMVAPYLIRRCYLSLFSF